VGIVWGHVWSIYLLLVPKLYWSFRKTPISVGLFFASIAKPLASSLAMGIILALLRHANLTEGAFGELCLGAIVAVLVYFGFWLVLPGGRAELGDLIADLSGQITPFKFLRRKVGTSPQLELAS
jgi:hypothetical protein